MTIFCKKCSNEMSRKCYFSPASQLEMNHSNERRRVWHDWWVRWPQTDTPCKKGWLRGEVLKVVKRGAEENSNKYKTSRDTWQNFLPFNLGGLFCDMKARIKLFLHCSIKVLRNFHLKPKNPLFWTITCLNCQVWHFIKI